jgi:hypothetical protein
VSVRADELRPAECMTCGRATRLNPSLPLFMLPRCGCHTTDDGAPATLNWSVDRGAGEPRQLICSSYPQPFANRDRVKHGRPGRGAVVRDAIAALRLGLDGDGLGGDGAR